MKSAMAGPVMVARHGAACRPYVRLPFLICTLFAFSGCACIIGPILEPIFKPIFETTFGSGIYIMEVSSAYYEENGRWPRDVDELVAFCEENDLMTFSDIEEGKGGSNFDIDICMFKDVLFTPRPDGKLEITYSFERRRPHANGAEGEETLTFANASAIVSPPGDDDPCGGYKAGTALKRRSKSAVPSSTPKPDGGSTDARSR